MKQHITIDQLNELSDKGKERLGEWWKNKQSNGDLIYDPYDKREGLLGYSTDHDSAEFFTDIGSNDGGYLTEQTSVDPRWCLPLLSIGQMIEFLTEPPVWIIHNRKQTWELETRGSTSFIENDELCDALWEAVKEVLES